MTKRIYVLTTIIICTAAIGLGIYTNQYISEDSDLSIKNIEALALSHGGDSGGEPMCAAGGCHSTECSFTGEIDILGNGVTYSNSIKCEDAWACCFTTAYCFPKDKCSC